MKYKIWQRDYSAMENRQIVLLNRTLAKLNRELVDFRWKSPHNIENKNLNRFLK
jgi:hypothetical protein